MIDIIKNMFVYAFSFFGAEAVGLVGIVLVLLVMIALIRLIP